MENKQKLQSFLWLFEHKLKCSIFAVFLKVGDTDP